MRVLVFGASGQLGVQALGSIPAGVQVLANSRRAPEYWRRAPKSFEVLAGDALELSALPDTDAWLSLGPLDLPVRLLARGLAPRQWLLAFSSTSRWAKATSADGEERAVAQRLEALEQALAQHAEARGLGLTVLRPTLIYGSGMDRSLTPLAHFAARYRCVPFPGLWTPGGLRAPVHAADLAQVAWRALEQRVPGSFDLPGGEVLPLREVVRRTVHSVAPGAVLLGIPRALFALALRWRGRNGPELSPGSLSRIDQDQVYSGAAARAALAWAPRGFAPTAATWQLPPWTRC